MHHSDLTSAHLPQGETSWRRFLWLYGSEMCSVTGTGLTAFALGAWVYAETRDTTAFALLSVAAILPGHLLLPLGGVLADLLPRRPVMWACNLLAGLCAIAIIALMASNTLTHGWLYFLLAISALCRTLQWITFTATMTLMVPPARLGRMSALIYLGEAGQQILAPMVAALTLPLLGHEGVIGMDVATFLFALIVLSITPIPPASSEDEAPRSASWRTVRDALLVGWRFIWQRRGLLVLQIFFALSQFLGGFLPILTLPALMELTQHSERVTGLTMGFAGLGLLAGAALLAWRPARGKRVRGTILCDVGSTTSLLLLSLGAPSLGAWWVGVWGFVFLAFHAMESGISQDLWQRKVSPPLQGRVFAIRRFISWSLVPLCYLLAGPLVDDVLTPLQPTLHEVLPVWFPGTAKLGAMMSLMAIAASARLFLLAPSTLLFKELWTLEEDLEDQI